MYPNLITLVLFCIAAGFTPGPNNILGSYQGFNFGIKKSLPLIIGVTFGYTFLLVVLAAGLIVIFKTYPLLQIVLKICGSIFLIYLAYKIAFQNKIEKRSVTNPVNFFDTFTFQFINPKGVIIGITTISTFVETGSNYLLHSFIVIGVSSCVAVTSITSWCLLGKFLRRFATNEKFIRIFNYVMSCLLIVCVIMFYI
jgi:threonine/homoserine/homoserine lactone efflux protein|tara:strand:- start:398 stop:988 length:591 start_codon:yes stop_codon:yes gene_type:complete